ncbi:hypothetical protein GCM10009744_65000 [Kribbella alba]|uniref:Uncharacterized protein n=2 Tax=Kribbella alba TaxID=190197 RepID=A0ABN2FYN4_9ACTN
MTGAMIDAARIDAALRVAAPCEARLAALRVIVDEALGVLPAPAGPVERDAAGWPILRPGCGARPLPDDGTAWERYDDPQAD